MRSVSWTCPRCERTVTDVQVCDGEDGYILPDPEWQALLRAARRADRRDALPRLGWSHAGRRGGGTGTYLQEGRVRPWALRLVTGVLVVLAVVPLVPGAAGALLTISSGGLVGRPACDAAPCPAPLDGAAALRVEYGPLLRGPGTWPTADRTYLVILGLQRSVSFGLEDARGDGHLGRLRSPKGTTWTSRLRPPGPFPAVVGTVGTADHVVVPLDRSGALRTWTIEGVPAQPVREVPSPLSQMPTVVVTVLVLAAGVVGWRRASVEGFGALVRILVSVLVASALAAWCRAAVPRTFARALGVTQASPAIAVATLVAIGALLLGVPAFAFWLSKGPATGPIRWAMRSGFPIAVVRSFQAVAAMATAVLVLQVVDQVLATTMIGWAP